jgi:1-aminocyclopropane-1-carboxylate deaminase/D-cysteine desulfhydrase-like pyridoxal-dependent ACC family enzyme
LLEKLQICAIPTPLHELNGLRKELDCRPLYAKRDDLLGRVLGGNKLRKLEYILAKAKEEGASTVITIGGFESNNIALLSILAGMYGLKAVIVLMGPRNSKPRNFNNAILAKLSVTVHMVDYIEGDLASRATVRKAVELKVEEITRQLSERGETVFYVPEGGSCLEGTYAFYEAFGELHGQMAGIGVSNYDICLSVGSGSSFAGLWCGVKGEGVDVNLIGISIALKQYRCRKEVIKAATRVCEMTGIEPPVMDELDIRDEFIGDGYGEPSSHSLNGVAQALGTEGLLLDHTYTGKAMGAMIELVTIGDYAQPRERPLVFWHTGGVPGAVDALSKELYQRSR